MKTKLIIYIGGFNLPDKNAAAQRVISNAKLLKQVGYEVFLIGLTHDVVSAGKEFDFEGFKCLNLPYPKSAKQWFEYLFSINWYKAYLKYLKPTIAIAYNHPAGALRKLLDYDKQHGIITLSDCTEWYEPDGNIIFKAIKGWDINQRMYKMHPRLDGMVVISNYLNDFYHGKGMKTLLLPPLVDLEDEKWNVEETRSDDSIRLVYAGSTGRNKDRLDMIIDALDTIYSNTKKDLLFNVVGMTKEQYHQTYPQTIGKNVPAFVFFWGHISHVEVIKLLRNSDFQIFIRENNLANIAGFPTKFAESISAGVLVLTNHSSDLKDYLHDGENGYTLDITNEETLVESLSRPLLLPFDDIQRKKSLIYRRTFDFRNYLDVTKTFFQQLRYDND